MTIHPIVSLVHAMIAGTFLVHCGHPQGELMDALPARYRRDLEVLQLSLAMNDKWSAIFSEKLNANVKALQHPDETFCERVTAADSPAIDPFHAVRTIASKCSHSGMYVKYGVKLLQYSAVCFFHRITVMHLSVVSSKMYGGPNEQFERFLDRLVEDYEVIANKLAVVGAPLTNVLQLAVFFREVRTLMAALDERAGPVDVNFGRKTERVTEDVNNMVRDEFDSVCAVKSTDWSDDVNDVVVDMTEVKVKKKKNKNKDKKKDKEKKNDEDAEKKDDDGSDPAISRADALRVLLRREFDKIMAEEMSPDVWRTIFARNLLRKHIDLQKTEENKTNSRTVIEEEEEEEEDFNF